MVARPILFNAEMVRALLDGRKTQTRRGLRYQDVDVSTVGVFRPSKRLSKYIADMEEVKCPYGRIGDLLWVRENMREDCAGSISFAQYSADGTTTKHEWWKPINYCPSIHMPRRLSRITLKITDIRVERVQDISERDAMAEGISEVIFRPDDGFPLCSGYMVGEDDGMTALSVSASKAYKELWSSINGNWDENPWVWVIEFEVIHINIDKVIKQ